MAGGGLINRNRENGHVAAADGATGKTVRYVEKTVVLYQPDPIPYRRVYTTCHPSKLKRLFIYYLIINYIIYILCAIRMCELKDKLYYGVVPVPSTKTSTDTT